MVLSASFSAEEFAILENVRKKLSAEKEADNTKKTEKEIDSATKDHTEFPDIRKSLTTPLFTHESPFGFNFEDACKKYSAKMEADNAHKTEKEIDGATKE